MISRTTVRFRKAYRALPARIRRQARDAYRLFQQEPSHPSLRFRQVHPTRPLFSARISRSYRTLGIARTIPLFGSGLVPMTNTNG